MANFKIHKVASSLPDQLEANTIYLVKTQSIKLGQSIIEGFDFYCTDINGTTAYKHSGHSFSYDGGNAFGTIVYRHNGHSFKYDGGNAFTSITTFYFLNLDFGEAD